MTHRIDEIDRVILYHLAADARTTTAPTMAEQVDVTPATIRNRIRQLEERGIVRGYHAAIDYEAADGKVTTQFTCTVPVNERSAIAADALATHGVVNVRELLAGQDNLLVTAVGEDTDDVDRIAHQLSELGATIKREDIVRTDTTQPLRSFAPDADGPPSAVRDLQSVAGGAEVVEFTVSQEAPVVGTTLEAANESGLLPDDVLVVSIERGDTRLTPSGDTRIEAGDVVSVFSPDAFPEALVESFAASVAGSDAG
ncbi:Lrp/AsnC family transcriptional regulator [Halobaculum lipolyticum]|uniref:TrkA C-terminal domain-containing protein n=1 Tax=Halobaculum lipolyticum TaxID=3032001 RepID=A0ABD5WCP8_9EURY|nr:Lrp/AsnC family transcriptional regulator [Halobaculum sp. DT31]